MNESFPLLDDSRNEHANGCSRTRGSCYLDEQLISNLDRLQILHSMTVAKLQNLDRNRLRYKETKGTDSVILGAM